MNEAMLEVPLDALPLPTRLMNWATSHGLFVLRDLVLWDPKELVEQRNLGRTSLAAARLTIEGNLDCSWEHARASLRPVDTSAPLPSLADAAWDDLVHLLPEEVLEFRLAQLDLTARLQSFAERSQLLTCRDLVTIPAAQLRSEPNLGRASIQSAREIFIGIAADPPSESRGFTEDLKAQLGGMSAVLRLVITRRAGMTDVPDTLQAIAETLGVTRERVRQIETKAIDRLKRKQNFISRIREEFKYVAPDGTLPFRDLNTAPWWTGIAAHKNLLTYYLDRVIDGEYRVIELDGQSFLSRFRVEQFETSYENALARLRGMAVPFPEARYASLVAQTVAELGPHLGQVADERLRGLVHLDGPAGDRTVVGIGRNRYAAILAYLTASPVPVRTKEIQAEFGRGHLPPQAIFVGRSLIGLEKHFPEMMKWGAELVPICLAIMNAGDPTRQWHSRDLFEELRDALELPGWLSHWHVASLLKQSSDVSYLGRLRVSLKSPDSSLERLHFKRAMLDAMVEAGSPVDVEDLLSRVRKRTSIPEMTLRMRLKDEDFVRVDAARWGLMERDVPGGSSVVAEIREFAYSALRQRGVGLTAYQLRRSATAEGIDVSGIGVIMLSSIIASSSLFRSAVRGGLGLAEWGSTRAPSQGETIRRLLEAGNGSARIDDIISELEQTFGPGASRASVGQLAYQYGGRLRGEHIQVVDLEAWNLDGDDTEDDDDLENYPSQDLDATVAALIAYAPPDSPTLDTGVMRKIYEVIDDPATGASASDQIFIDGRIASKVLALKTGSEQWMLELAAAASALYDLWLHHRGRSARLSERALRYVRAGLHYLVNPADVIPDDTEEIGHLDDSHALHYALDQLTAHSDWLGASDD